MQYIFLVLILKVVIFPSCLVRSEHSTIVSKTGEDTNIIQDNQKIWYDSDSICGTRTLPANGTPFAKWPWVASIYFKDPSANEQAQLYGTASIITERHLITIAKVVTSRDTNSSVVVPTDLFAVVGGKYGENGILHYIQKIYKYFRIHDDPILGGGLAIVKVVNKILFTDYIRPICLPGIEYHSAIQQQNQSFTTISWNNSSDNSTETPVLNEVNVQIQFEDYCQQFIEGPYPIYALFCGQRSEETTYKFDNGGPLMTSINRKFTVFGATDKDIGQGLPSENSDIPIYFLRTDSFTIMDWITKIIQESLK